MVKIQATTKTETTKHTTTAAAVSQITDGQVQATTKTETTKHTSPLLLLFLKSLMVKPATTKTQTTAEAKPFLNHWWSSSSYHTATPRLLLLKLPFPSSIDGSSLSYHSRPLLPLKLLLLKSLDGQISLPPPPLLPLLNPPPPLPVSLLLSCPSLPTASSGIDAVSKNSGIFIYEVR